MSAAAMEMATPSAGPPPEFIVPAEFIRARTVAAIVLLAGKVGERRSRAGVTPGWRMHRSSDELKAFHEAGHAAVAHLLGQHVHRLSIITDETVTLKTAGPSKVLGGYCQCTPSAELPPPPARNRRTWNDIHYAAEAAKVIALNEPGRYSWRLVMKVVRHLRERAESLVEVAWRALIVPLATELAKRGELDAKQIAKFLSDDTRGIADL